MQRRVVNPRFKLSSRLKTEMAPKKTIGLALLVLGVVLLITAAVENEVHPGISCGFSIPCAGLSQDSVIVSLLLAGLGIIFAGVILLLLDQYPQETRAEYY
jgi:drug/metabolite transporter (DMT)-like permease